MPLNEERTEANFANEVRADFDEGFADDRPALVNGADDRHSELRHALAHIGRRQIGGHTVAEYGKVGHEGISSSLGFAPVC
jgi:hypothetical protein